MGKVNIRIYSCHTRPELARFFVEEFQARRRHFWWKNFKQEEDVLDPVD
jgi:hypothetical protein